MADAAGALRGDGKQQGEREGEEDQEGEEEEERGVSDEDGDGEGSECSVSSSQEGLRINGIGMNCSGNAAGPKELEEGLGQLRGMCEVSQIHTLHLFPPRTSLPRVHTHNTHKQTNTHTHILFLSSTHTHPLRPSGTRSPSSTLPRCARASQTASSGGDGWDSHTNFSFCIVSVFLLLNFSQGSMVHYIALALLPFTLFNAGWAARGERRRSKHSRKPRRGWASCSRTTRRGQRACSRRRARPRGGGRTERRGGRRGWRRRRASRRRRRGAALGAAGRRTERMGGRRWRGPRGPEEGQGRG